MNTCFTADEISPRERAPALFSRQPNVLPFLFVGDHRSLILAGRRGKSFFLAAPRSIPPAFFSAVYTLIANDTPPPSYDFLLPPQPLSKGSPHPVRRVQRFEFEALPCDKEAEYLGVFSSDCPAGSPLNKSSPYLPCLSQLSLTGSRALI